VARGRTNSSNAIIAEVAIVARPIETFKEVIKEVDFIEIVVFKADQTIYTLVHIRRDAIYT
jgi:hypothetical protein